jgi:hypothetical protein
MVLVCRAVKNNQKGNVQLSEVGGTRKKKLKIEKHAPGLPMLFNVCFKCSGNRGQALVVLYRTNPMCNRYKSKQEATTLGEEEKNKRKKNNNHHNNNKGQKNKTTTEEEKKQRNKNIKETKTSKKQKHQRNIPLAVVAQPVLFLGGDGDRRHLLSLTQ